MISTTEKKSKAKEQIILKDIGKIKVSGKQIAIFKLHAVGKLYQIGDI